jgi:hypothetical protein
MRENVSHAPSKSWVRRPHGRFALAAAAALAATACGSSASLTQDVELNVAMTGVLEAPADAVGDTDPKSLTFQLTDASITSDEGEATDLYTADEPTSVRIISRSQIILTAPLKALVGKTFSKISLTFDPTVTGQGKKNDALSTTLAAPTIEYTAPIKVETGKSMRLDVEVQWKNTIAKDADTGEEALSAPAFTLALDDK